MTLLGTVLVVACVLTGCSQSPVEPVTLDNGGAPNLVDITSTTVDSSVVWTQGWVTVAKGGVVPLGMPGKFHDLYVSAGSVTQDALVTVKTTTFYFPGGKVVTFDFGPEGMLFTPAAKMKVDASIFGPGKVTQVSLFYLNPLSGEWELQQIANVVKSAVTFDIHHFSKYGIS